MTQPGAVTHMAWDQGAIAQVLDDLFGTSAAAVQKTTKTMCGRRVTMARIDNGAPTCDECSAAWVTGDDEARAALRSAEAVSA